MVMPIREPTPQRTFRWDRLRQIFYGALIIAGAIYIPLLIGHWMKLHTHNLVETSTNPMPTWVTGILSIFFVAFALMLIAFTGFIIYLFYGWLTEPKEGD